MRAGLVGVFALPLLSCNPIAYLHKLPIRAVHSPYLVNETAGPVVLEFTSLLLTGSGGKRVGFELKGGQLNGSLAGVCELVSTGNPAGAVGFYPQVTCPMPALPVGRYALFATGDAACPGSMHATGFDIEVIEPAHVSRVSPSALPLGTTGQDVTVYGSNIGAVGIDQVACVFTFSAAPGAKFGCSMTQASYPADSATPTSAVCGAPKWPGPLLQCGADGCVPLEGAVCDPRVHVQLTNDAKVYSPEPLVLQYNTALVA